MIRLDDREALDALDLRIKTLLPEEYQDSYETVQPVSMGSAGLKYDGDGKVAWNEIWGSFCDLAMAGGPPHKGTLLLPGSRDAIETEPDRYIEVVEEICRGITMATELPANPSPTLGWIRVECLTQAMAGWLLRAIVMENVAVRRDGLMIDLPAAPHFQLWKEIKNVVTVIAKTCHYWMGHMPVAQQRAIAALFAEMDRESPLIEPALAIDDDEGANDDARADRLQATAGKIADAIQRDPGLLPSAQRYAGWLGVECPSVRAAVWMMRALVVHNVLSRREGTALFLPVNPITDPDGEEVVRSMRRIHGLASARGVI
jgi:sirohydrochlorin cobaltochelatase